MEVLIKLVNLTMEFLGSLFRISPGIRCCFEVTFFEIAVLTSTRVPRLVISTILSIRQRVAHYELEIHISHDGQIYWVDYL